LQSAIQYKQGKLEAMVSDLGDGFSFDTSRLVGDTLEKFRHYIWDPELARTRFSELRVSVPQLTAPRDVRLFVMLSGHLGVSNTEVEEGDKIVIVAGSKTPLVIRPRGDSYTFISSCYVAGVMKGEAWLEDVDSRETFVLV
jgi:hypothetical protein